jgi:hypothetical protein
MPAKPNLALLYGAAFLRSVSSSLANTEIAAMTSVSPQSP